jgi:hypothetical protein
MNAKTLLVIGDAIEPAREQAGPRRDYEALRDALDADVLHAGDVPSARGRGRGGIAIARVAARRARDYDNVYCDSEHIGMPLAFLLGRSADRPRLTMIGHYLTPFKKRALFRALRLARRIDAIAVHSPAQAARATGIGFRDDQVRLVPYQVDARYWRPTPGDGAGDYIASAGQEFRDYRTLIRATEGLPVGVQIAAGSHWSSRSKDIDEHHLPANVSVRRRPYHELREMYAGARFVVVALHDVDFQAGIITIL